jgi:hypothetical protein
MLSPTIQPDGERLTANSGGGAKITQSKNLQGRIHMDGASGAYSK